METILVGHLDFNDFMLLLFWIFSITFAAYIMSHAATSIVRFVAAMVKSYKNPSKYNIDYNSKFLKFKDTPLLKGVKKNHGKRIPFFNKRG